MADLTDLQAAQTVKIAGADSTGVELAFISSQTSGAQQALDVGINVAGVQVDPRTRTWTLSSGTDSITTTGSISLPPGAATEATLAKLTQTQGSTTSGQSGPLVQGAVTTSDPTYTTAQTDPLSLTTVGRLRTDVTGNVASGTSDSGHPVKTAGIINVDGTLFTNGHRINTQMNEAGSTYTDHSGRLASYSAFSSFTTAALATDIFTITGSATKTVKIRTVIISGTNTGNTNALVLMLKRSTANTLGTSTTLTNVPNDSNNAAGTATVRSYTVSPTLGTLVGNIEGELIFLPTLASSNSSSNENITYGDDGTQPITLRGTSEVFAVNLNGVSLLGTTVMNISINWTEE